MNEDGALYRAITRKITAEMPRVNPDDAIRAYKIVQRVQATEMHPEDSVLVRALTDELGFPPAVPFLIPKQGENPDEGDAWVAIASKVDAIIQEGLEKPRALSPADESPLARYVREYTPPPARFADLYATNAFVPNDLLKDLKYKPIFKVTDDIA